MFFSVFSAVSLVKPWKLVSIVRSFSITPLKLSVFVKSQNIFTKFFTNNKSFNCLKKAILSCAGVKLKYMLINLYLSGFNNFFWSSTFIFLSINICKSSKIFSLWSRMFVSSFPK